MANIRSKRPLKNMTRAHSANFKTYNNFAADIDLNADGPQLGSNSPCCEIHVFPTTAGVLAVQRLDGTTVLLQCPQAWVHPVEVMKILTAGTTMVGNITVYW